MSIHERVGALERQVRTLQAEVKTLKARDEEVIKQVVHEAMVIFLKNQVEFSMSTDGQIKELING